jgi:hypothetical protein
MGLEPHEIDLDGLPRTIGGGLKREPVEELLRRVQWEYSQLYFEHKRLKESGVQPAPERQPPAPQPVAQEPPPPAAPAETQVEQVEPVEPVAKRPRREANEVGWAVLASAHRASLELRESARRECDLMLKKARARIVQMEREFERTKQSRATELEELDAMLSEIREQMRATLESLEPEPVLQGHSVDTVEELASPGHVEIVSIVRSAEASVEVAAAEPEAHVGADHPGFEAAS